MYHELVYHLDLCILAYHQYCQALLWPFDPYYEQAANPGSDRRTTLLRNVHTHVNRATNPAAATYRGPGQTQNWAANLSLDPILQRYDRLYPWDPAFCKPLPGEWLIYKPPTAITQNIHTVFMAAYHGHGVHGSFDPNSTIRNGGRLPGDATRVQAVNVNPAGGTDFLYGFEGGTGSVSNSAVSWSHMGIVLDRDLGGGDYDVHIAFRGSRSGSGARALTKGLGGTGNPDWVSDMDMRATVQEPFFSHHGGVCRGFSRAVKTCIPTILDCLEHIHARRGRRPSNIYVTGHSLGGALATQFTTAIVVGSVYGPNGNNLSANVRTWPWRNTRLITFSAPVAGDDHFIKNFNAKVYCRRVLLGRDPITQEKIGSHVGATVHVSAETTLNPLPLGHHEPALVRERLIRKVTEWGDNIGAVPAPVSTTAAWPWKTYTNFKQMYQAEAALQNAPALRRMLGVYNTDAERYVSLIENLLSASDAYKRKTLESTRQNKVGSAHHAVDHLAHPTFVGPHFVGPALTRLNTTIGNVTEHLQGDLGKALGLVLLLTELARNQHMSFADFAAQPLLNACTQEV